MTVHSYLLTLGSAAAGTLPDDSGPGWALRLTGVEPRGLSTHDDGALLTVVDGQVLDGSSGDVPGGASAFAAAHARWGADVLAHLRGAFTAVVVERSSGRTRAFRSLAPGPSLHLGSDGRGGSAVGTDLHEVAVATGNAGRPSPVWVADYLQDHIEGSGVPTAYDGTERLANGHRAEIVDGSWHQTRGARWKARRHRVRDLEDAATLVERALDSAVRRVTHHHQHVAVTLSGGLDSSNLLASVRRVLRPDQTVTALCVPFEDTAGDERDWQRAIAAHLDVGIVWVDVSAGGPLSGLGEGFLDGRTEPPLTGNWFFAQAVARAAAEHGLTLVLDGEDADSLFTGSHAYLADQVAQLRLPTLVREVRRLRALGWGKRRFFDELAPAVLPPAAMYRLTGPPTMLDLKPVVAADLARATRLRERIAAQPAVRMWAPGRRFRSAQQLAGQPGVFAEVVAEVGLAAQGLPVEMGHPYLDHDLVETAFGLPWWVLRGRNRPKMVLRTLAARHLPDGFSEASSKAVLSSYYDDAFAGKDAEAVARGLASAARRPEVFDAATVARLRAAGTAQDSWLPARTAVLALWLDELDARASAQE